MNITINHLIKKFGDKTVVNIPEFSIPQGQIVGLVGNNGAGKTTLFRLMLDLLSADEGNISYMDESNHAINPATSEEWKNWIGAYIDEGFLIDFLTTEELFEFICKLGNHKYILPDFLQEYKDKFTNEEIFGTNKLIREFSAGNKQKIGILSAMLNLPKILILDEPFNFLDPSSQNLLKVILKNYCYRTNATILVSSHNLQHTTDICNRIVLLEHGVIIKDFDNTDETAKEVLTSYFKVQE